MAVYLVLYPSQPASRHDHRFYPTTLKVLHSPKSSYLLVHIGMIIFVNIISAV